MRPALPPDVPPLTRPAGRLSIWLPALLAVTACAGAEPGSGDASAQPAAASAPAAPATTPTRRWIVHSADDWPSAEAFGARAAEVAGTPLRQVSASNPRQFVLVLDCADEARCQAAAARLAADTRLVRSIEPDRLMRLPTRPGGPAVR